MKKVINRGKKSKTLSEVRPVKNISKNLFSRDNSYKLQDHAYEY